MKNHVHKEAPPGMKHHRNYGKYLYTAFLAFTLIACNVQPVMAATIWDKASEIMKDVYNQIILISTIFLTFYAKDIVDLLLNIAGTPYSWILTEDLPPLEFAKFNSVITVILGVCANGAVAIVALILVLILAWNYIKLLFEAAERYILLGVLVYTAPVAFSTGASQATGNVFKSWCRMLGGQFFLLLMNAWCLRLFTSMVGTFLANPLSL